MTTVTTLAVTGMTCGHCVSSVTSELRGIDAVQDVSVELRVDDASLVRVISETPLDEAPLREAVDEAGYDLARIEVLEDAVAAESAAQAPAKQAGRTLPIIRS